MPPISFERVHDRVYRLGVPFEGGGLTNMYLVRGAKTAVIDTAVLGAPTEYLAPALEEIGLGLGQVDYVLNTHGHMDHLGGNSEMKDAGAEIAIHSADAERTRNNRGHVDRSADGLAVLGLMDRLPAREAMLLRLLGREVGCDRELEDGDVVDLGNDLKLTVVHTPGHTPGAVCYYWEAAGILITGDSIQARGSRVGGMPVLEDPSVYPSSLKKAEGVGATTLFMGHAFKGRDGDLGPVATGGTVADVFRESHLTHEAWMKAVSQALSELPNGSGGERAMRAVGLLRESFALNDVDGGYPSSGTTTIPAYLRTAAR
ncbi:MAG: MBL fold metallo-hydrolase [Chloroflexi bacterium]|nr:MBL fold metallo-hydrolase [Chloroflexota bacterium]